MSKDRENFIRESFEEQEVRFSYPQDLYEFDFLIENFMQKKSEYVDNNELGEELAISRLIVMDDLSGFAEKSDLFQNFLTVS